MLRQHDLNHSVMISTRREASSESSWDPDSGIRICRSPNKSDDQSASQSRSQGKDKAKFATGDCYRDDEYDDGGDPLAI